METYSILVLASQFSSFSRFSLDGGIDSPPHATEKMAKRHRSNWIILKHIAVLLSLLSEAEIDKEFKLQNGEKC